MAEVSQAADVDDWIEKLISRGFFVSCSSGTTGKSAMLVASQRDLDWCKTEAVAAYTWGSDVKPLRDRRIFAAAAVARVPRNEATAEAYTAALQDPRYERFAYPVPSITVGSLTRMIVLRKATAEARRNPRTSRLTKNCRRSAKRPWTTPSASRHARSSQHTTTSCMSVACGRDCTT
jgi:hypothetical protein